MIRRCDLMARRNGDNIGHRCRVTLVEIVVFGADAKRAAEKLGLTVGGEWPSGRAWRSRMPPRCCRLGLELVEEQVIHDRDPQAQAVGRARLAAQRQQAWAGEVD
jgi:hypothetical protein